MKFSTTSLVFLAAAANVAHGFDVPSLTPDNYADLTDGKTVFLKFFAPWCGHCKKMAPDWEKLSQEWDGDKVGLVAEVDCTAEGKPLCDENGVRGFPTLKYGDPSALDDYQGGRDLASLKTFAKENLKPVCSANNIDLCDDEKKAEIMALMELSAEEISTKITAEQAKLDAAEENFKAEVQKLQETYQKLTEEKDAILAGVKSGGLGLLKSVQAAKAKAGNDEL
uniref:Thioredoxin domain-containing protein n=1 Tax=Entomoneis paludosa TaxID=265537 RepID=A0A7S2YEL3_9STRA